MRHPKVRDLLTIARRTWRAITAGAVILNYHRVADLESDPWGVAVSRQHFSEHLEVIRRLGLAVRLKDLVEAHRRRRMPRRSVVLTFDDGYLDSLRDAKPCLERAGIPATFYVTTARFAARREYWWDELEWLLLRPGTLPSVLRLTIRGETKLIELAGAADYSETDWRRDRSVRVWEARPGTRLSFYMQVHAALKQLQHPEQQAALDAIAEWSGATPPVRSTHLTLDADEVVELAGGNAIDIGAHTRTHTDLSNCDPALQEREIAGAKESLQEILGSVIESFAYPYGTFGPESAEIVRRAGFTNACAMIKTSVRSSSHPYLLPRIGVPDCDGDAFERLLRRSFQS